MEVRLGVFWLNFDSCLEILNRILMVAHVLVNQATLNVDCLVVGQKLLHLGKLLECLMELLCSSVHEAKMEHRRYKGTAAIQRVFEEAYRKLYLFLFVFVVRLSFLRLYFRFRLIS